MDSNVPVPPGLELNFSALSSEQAFLLLRRAYKHAPGFISGLLTEEPVGNITAPTAVPQAPQAPQIDQPMSELRAPLPVSPKPSKARKTAAAAQAKKSGPAPTPKLIKKSAPQAKKKRSTPASLRSPSASSASSVISESEAESSFMDADDDITERDSDSSPNSSDSGFTLVAGRKRKKETSSAPPTQDSSPPPSTVPPPERKVKPPPPIFLRQKEKWEAVSTACRMRGIIYTHARSTKDGIKVQVPTPSDHRKLTAFLRDQRIGFHTYALEDERLLRVVIRGLPVEITPDSIKADLCAQGFPVREVHRMYNGRTKTPFELVLVVLNLTPEGKAIFDLKMVNNLSGLHVETPHRNGTPSQCHRCQLYGHSARNCFAQPRCVKCLGDHGTADCTRTRDTSEPPSCVLCGASGHTANYRGCPKAPKADKRATRRPAPARAKTSQPQYTKTTPKVAMAPPATAPQNAWSKPLPMTSSASQAKPAPPCPKKHVPKYSAPPSQDPKYHHTKPLFEEGLSFAELLKRNLEFARIFRSLTSPLAKSLYMADQSALLTAISELSY